MRRLTATLISCVAFAIVVRADTLVMRDGRRVQGELISVRDGVVDFEVVRSLFGARDRLRVDRADVVRIELDENVRSRDDRRNEEPAAQRPPGLREREISVNAAAAWSDTGITVRPGQTIFFEASGRVRWGPGRQDGPAGESRSPRNEGRPIPGRPAAALIGRVGESRDAFFIGDDPGPIRMRDGGRLYLGINDDFLQDNSGAFRVTVYY